MLPCLEIYFGGWGIISNLLRLLFFGNKAGHQSGLDVLVFLLTGFVQQQEIHLGQLAFFFGNFFLLFHSFS